MLALVSVLSRRGNDVAVAVPGDGPLETLVRDAAPGVALFRSPGHRWVSPRAGGPAGAIRLLQCVMDLPRVARLLRSTAPDVVVVNTSVTPAPMLAATLMRIPCVVLVREAIASNPVMASAVSRRTLVKALHAWSDCLVAVSDFVGRQVDADLVVLEHVAALAPQPRTERTGPLRAAVIGAVTRDKGQLDAVEAVRHARARGADVVLELHGPGSERDVAVVRDRARAVGISDFVRIEGEADDVSALLARTDVLLVPSRHEAFGRVTVEALHAGVPVVGYRAGGTTEALSRGGGVLIEPSAAAMGDAIARLASDGSMLAALTRQAAGAGALWRLEPTDGDLADVVEIVARGEGDRTRASAAPESASAARGAHG